MADSRSRPLITAICLANETSSQPSHQLGSVCISSSEEKASNLRQSILSSILLPTISGNDENRDESVKRNFVFLNRAGWEVSESMEHLVSTETLLWDDNSIRIRFKFLKTRLALCIRHQQHGSQVEQAFGFVFVDDFMTSVAKFRDDIAHQHPQLNSKLNESGYVFLDSNKWPVSCVQEDQLLLIDIVTNYSVVILLGASTIPSLSQPYAHSHLAVSLPVPHSKGTNDVEDVDSGAVLTSLPYQPTHEILLSYVHKEATAEAIKLKAELERHNFTVFLDVDSIKAGVDWQDVLNDAISNCSIFIPLITESYGRTLWTNREIKLADILAKEILPVNFLSKWPPSQLAIQFATTQYIGWTPPSTESKTAVCDPSDLTKLSAVRVAQEVYKKTRKSTSTIEVDDCFSDSTPPLTKIPSLKSCGSIFLPKTTPSDLKEMILQPREGKPLVITISHNSEHQFSTKLRSFLEEEGYEVWSVVGKCRDQDEFKDKVDEAGAVILTLSGPFGTSSQCEQMVYYCEGRKRIIPIIMDTIKLPLWISSLIGTSTFLDSRSATFRATLKKKLQAVFDPSIAEEEMKKNQSDESVLNQKSISLSQQLPKQKLIYISGGTKFFSKIGESLCYELGKQLAGNLDHTLVTGGFYGVGETVGRAFLSERTRLKWPTGIIHIVAERDDEDKSTQTRQNPDGSFPDVPYGLTLCCGSSVRQREMLVPRVVKLCVLVEGGPGAAFEASQFNWNGHQVIPVSATGGAASGMFNLPPSIFTKPKDVNESDWLMLKDSSATSSSLAAAIVRVIDSLNTQ